MQIVRVVTVIVLIFASFGYAAYELRTNGGDIVIQASDFFQKAALPYRILQLSLQEPDAELLIPFPGLRKSDIDDTWGEARAEGRSHEGTDIFQPRKTPIFSATEGYVLRVGQNDLGGNIVFVVGKGGVRYYYAHLDSFAKGIEVGDYVTTDTVLGFVGNTGNAADTPPHLHFGMYKNGAQNPYALLVER